MSLTVKAYLDRPGAQGTPPEQEIRRFAIDPAVSSSYDYLSRKVAQVFPCLSEPGNFQLFWKDGEGDLVSFSSDEELLEALGFVSDGIFRIYVKATGSGSSQPTPGDAQPDGTFHPNVVCDGCNGPVMGSRFKCTVCADFDLCGRCEGLGLHPEHELLRMRNPAAPGHNPFFAMFGPPPPPPGCPPPPGHGPHHGPPPHYPGQPGFGPGGPGWFMPRRWWRQWARGMFGPGGPGGRGGRRCREEEPQAEAAEPTEGQGPDANPPTNEGEEKQEGANQEAGTAGPRTEAGGSAGPRTDGGEAPPPFDYLQHVGQAVASMLDPLGIDVDIDVEHQGQRRKCPRRWAEFEGSWGQGSEGAWGHGSGGCHWGGKGGKKGFKKAMKMQKKMCRKGRLVQEEEEREVPVTVETVTMETQEEKEQQQGEKQGEEEVMEVTKDDSSSSDVDGWTHLSPKEGEFTNDAGEGPTTPPTTADSPPKQKRKDQEAVVTSQPPTAGTAGTGGTPVTTQPSPSRPSAPPAAPADAEFDKQLKEAIAQMEAMGFRDDGGWLSSLLVAKGYDIAAVLDSIYPAGRKPDSLPPYV